MAKISRAPFNGTRWVSGTISTDRVLRPKSSGQCLFIEASSTVNITINYAGGGAYYKFIVRDDTTAAINIVFPAMEGVLIFDDTSTVGLTNAGESNQTTLTIPSGASAGTYVDAISDGSKWYITGMAHGVQWTQS